MKKKFEFLRVLLLLSLIALPGALSRFPLGHSNSNGQLLTYQSTGPSVSMYFQRINDSSFETGTQSWTEIAYNNYSSSVSIVPTGYNDNSAAQLTINSGNLTVDSYLTLVQDFSKNPVEFGNSLRFRAAIQELALQGFSATDRIEVSLTLTTSIGSLARIHYVLTHFPALLTNTTGDAYITIGPLGPLQWILLDRNLANDVVNVFPGLGGSISAIKDARLWVYSTSQGIPTLDPRIKYYETGGDNYWNTTETVVFDPDADGSFNPATDWILYRGSTIPTSGQSLKSDSRIKFVDNNLNGQWDPGEPIVYDLKDEGVYDFANNDPVINGTAVAGSLLQDPVRMQTNALLDQVELYSPTGSFEMVRHGGFETGGFTGWGNTAGFAITTNPTHSGSYGSLGTAVGTTIDLAQSIDARPSIDSSARLKASVYLGGMTGGSSADKVDVWLGIVDSSPQANPLSVYYYFKTGAGSVALNTTDTVNHAVAGFGTTSQWLSLNESLVPDTAHFNLTGYTAPYRIEAVALEVSASPGSTTSSYFDDVSIQTSYRPDPAVSTYYAVDGINSTYTYISSQVPQGQFYLGVPSGQTLLNITSPAGTVLQRTDYSIQTLGGSLLIALPAATTQKYPSFGTWRFDTTSLNALTSLYANPAGSEAPSSAFDTSSSVTFVSQSKDPLGNPLAGSNVTLIFYSPAIQAINGIANGQGWYNQTGVTLPQNPGFNTLEAITKSSSYIGLRTAQLTISSSFPWAAIVYGAIVAVGLVVFGLFLLKRNRDRTRSPTPEKNAKPSSAKTAKNQA